MKNTCIAIRANSEVDHEKMDTWGKQNNMTVVYSPWHPNPDYRVFKTGTLLSRNNEYPSGVVIVDDKGKTHPYKKD